MHWVNLWCGPLVEQQTVTWPLSRASTKWIFVSQQGPGVNEACGCDGQSWALCCPPNGSLGVSKRGRTGADGAHGLIKPSHSSTPHLHENEAWSMWSNQIHLLFGSPSAAPAYAFFLSLIDYLLPMVSYIIGKFLDPHLYHARYLAVLLPHTSYSLFRTPLPAPNLLVLPPLNFFLVWRFFPAPPLPRQPHSHGIERAVKREG